MALEKKELIAQEDFLPQNGNALIVIVFLCKSECTAQWPTKDSRRASRQPNPEKNLKFTERLETPIPWCIASSLGSGSTADIRALKDGIVIQPQVPPAALGAVGALPDLKSGTVVKDFALGDELHLLVRLEGRC